MERKEQDYMQDLREIRSIMERSTKFLSLSGISGVLAGLYALAGAYLAFKIFEDQDALVYGIPSGQQVWDLLVIGLTVLVLAVTTAIVFSARKAKKRGQQIWNSAAKRMLVNMAVPLVTGGILVLLLLAKGLILLMAPVTLIFYGLALYNASKFTYSDVKYFGFVQLLLGLLGIYFTQYSLLVWAIGFGVMHIIYGIYVNYKYEG
jgi:uncharacterized membrane protein